MPRLALRALFLVALSLSAGRAVAAAEDTVLFDFAKASAADWAPAKLPDVKTDAPAPKVEIVTGGDAAKGLKLTFDGGVWPVVGTAKIPVGGNWKEFQTLKADLETDRPGVAYFRLLQGKPDATGKQPLWEKTMILPAGRSEVVLTIRHGISSTVIDPAKGQITALRIGMFRPEKGQTLTVSSIRLSPDWPPPQATGWFTPYNHDGYSAAFARDYRKTGKLPRFKVLGTDLEVASYEELSKQLKDKWTKPEPRTIDQVEAEFKAEFEKLKKDHPKAVLAILRDGEKGVDPAQPGKVYAGWKCVYLSCHGPDGPNPGRENTPRLYDTVEAFMRHRSPLMQADLSVIPKGAAILAARLVITRMQASDLKPPEKPNLWVAEPCNREWDPAAATCYQYAPGKLWKAVSGLYYGEDPDFWPVFLMHGPAGGGPVSVWDFTEALKFWTDGRHENHGFFFYGDSSDYMRMVTPLHKDVKLRPAILVIFDPKG
jgi:hypothetical protein